MDKDKHIQLLKEKIVELIDSDSELKQAVVKIYQTELTNHIADLHSGDQGATVVNNTIEISDERIEELKELVISDTRFEEKVLELAKNDTVHFDILKQKLIIDNIFEKRIREISHEETQKPEDLKLIVIRDPMFEVRVREIANAEW